MIIEINLSVKIILPLKGSPNASKYFPPEKIPRTRLGYFIYSP